MKPTYEQVKTYDLEEVIAFVKKHDLGCGIFNTRSLVDDSMETIYSKNGVTVDACDDWGYLEIFGLKEEDFAKLLREVSNHD